MDQKEIILYDNDLDGMLSAALYLTDSNKDVVPLTLDELAILKNKYQNKLKLDKIISFDIPYDKLIRALENINVGELTLFDHHYSTKFSSLPSYKINFILELFSPTTYDIVKKYIKEDSIKEFENKYSQLINYMRKAENDEFEKMDEKDLLFYFNYYEITSKLGKNLDLYTKLSSLLELYEAINPRKLSKEFIISKEKEELNKSLLYSIFVDRLNRYIFFFKNGFQSFNVPFFYKNKEWISIKRRDNENKYIATFRVKKELWDFLINNYEGGGRKLNNGFYAGGIIIKDKDKLDRLILKFIGDTQF